MTRQRTGDLYAMLCAVVCALGNIVAKAGLENISIELFNFYFFLFAFIVSIFFCFNRRTRIEIRQTKPKTIGFIFFLSLFFTFGIYTFLLALKSIEPATVSFLSRIEVIILLVLAIIFLKEKLRPLEIIGGAVAIGGVIMLKYQTNLEISKAATLMIISACFFAVAEIFVKKNIDRLGNARFLFFRNFFTVLIMIALIYINNARFYVPDIKTLALTFSAAMLLPILGRLTFLESMRRIDLSRAVLITQATPLMTLVFAGLILNSIPSGNELLGGGIILLGILLVKFQKDKTAAPIRY